MTSTLPPVPEERTARWLDQTILHDPEQPEVMGNCWQTCIASLLHLPLDEVPHFVQGHESMAEVEAATRAWALTRGYDMVEVGSTWLAHSRALVMLHGRSPRDVAHVVVGRGDETIHDPHPSRAGLSSIGGAFVFMPLDPAPSSPDKGTAARDVADAVDSCPGCEAPLWPDNLTVCWNCGQTVIDYGPEFRTAPAPDKGTGRPDTTQMRADADWLRNQQFGTVAYTKADRIDDTADWIDAHTPQPDGLAECLASAVNRATHGRVHLDGEEAELACRLLVADPATPRTWCCNAPAGVRRCLPDTPPPAALTDYHNDCHWGTNQ